MNEERIRSTELCGVVAVAVLWAAVGSGCPPEPPADTNFDPQILDLGGADADSGDGTGSRVYDPVVVPTIDGTWLQYSQISTCVSLGTIVEESLSRTLFIIESSQSEQRLVDESWRACKMELPSLLGLQIYASEGLLRTAYPVETERGLVTGTALGGGYASGLLAEVWGVDLDEPLTDPFPESADDPRIYDSDLDGNPGATVLVGDSCETYLIQRAVTVFSGAYTAPDRIAGTLVSYTEPLTIGATLPFCATSYATRSNAARSSFERVRIDGRGGSLDLDDDGDGEITCEEVLPWLDRLFERRAADDEACRLD